MAQRPESMGRATKSASWQDDAWRFYDEVGELRFGIGWLANGMSRVNLVAARQPEHQGDEPSAIEMPDEDDPEAEPLSPDELAAVDLVAAIAGGSDGQGQLLAASCIQLSVPGIGFVLMEAEPTEAPPVEGLVVEPVPGETPMPTPDDTWCWRVLAADELRSQGEVYEVATGQGAWRPLLPDHVLVKVWRPHPRRSWEPDSPCRAVLGVLRQITLLDEHVQATATSRLAGAGVFVLPTEAEFVPLPQPGQTTTPASDNDDDFTDVLVETMTLPIGDRGTAAAVVPLVVRIPGELCDKPRHLTFWSEFNADLLPLRESAVKRLALGMDMPPEVLTGMSGMNHWGAWQVEETAITLHIEPLAETIVHALTIGYFRPALRAAGVADPEAFMVWYDTTDLTTRPDRSADATAAYDRMELSGSALRREAGLAEDDAPDEDELTERRLWAIASGNQQLAAQALTALGIPMDAPEPSPAPPGAGVGNGPPAAPSDAEGPPGTQDDAMDDAEPDDLPAIAAAAMLEACDALVSRALEKVGHRLRSAAGKRRDGGAAAIVCDDPTLLHTTLVATDYARLSDLLADAWPRAGLVADRYGLPAAVLVQTLDNYTRGLIATGQAHDPDRLADALGLHATA